MKIRVSITIGILDDGAMLLFGLNMFLWGMVISTGIYWR